MPSDYYDYILGFGDMFRLARKRNPKAFAVIYMTENPYAVSYANEQERIDYFYERTHKKIPLSRTGNFYIKGDEDLADAVICLGEKKYFPDLFPKQYFHCVLDLFFEIVYSFFCISFLSIH